MVVTLRSTTKLVELETPSGRVPARVWEGTTDSGIPVHALITRIAVHGDEDVAQFERELQECAAPTPVIETVYTTRLVL